MSTVRTQFKFGTAGSEVSCLNPRSVLRTLYQKTRSATKLKQRSLQRNIKKIQGRANSFTWGTGHDSGVGYLLHRYGDVKDLTPFQDLHTLIIDDGEREITIQHLCILRFHTILFVGTPDSLSSGEPEYDDSSIVMIEIADKRWALPWSRPMTANPYIPSPASVSNTENAIKQNAADTPDNVYFEPDTITPTGTTMDWASLYSDSLSTTIKGAINNALQNNVSITTRGTFPTTSILQGIDIKDIPAWDVSRFICNIMQFEMAITPDGNLEVFANDTNAATTGKTKLEAKDYLVDVELDHGKYAGGKQYYVQYRRTGGSDVDRQNKIGDTQQWPNLGGIDNNIFTTANTNLGSGGGSGWSAQSHYIATGDRRHMQSMIHMGPQIDVDEDSYDVSFAHDNQSSCELHHTYWYSGFWEFHLSREHQAIGWYDIGDGPVTRLHFAKPKPLSHHLTVDPNPTRQILNRDHLQTELKFTRSGMDNLNQTLCSYGYVGPHTDDTGSDGTIGIGGICWFHSLWSSGVATSPGSSVSTNVNHQTRAFNHSGRKLYFDSSDTNATALAYGFAIWSPPNASYMFIGTQTPYTPIVIGTQNGSWSAGSVTVDVDHKFNLDQGYGDQPAGATEQVTAQDPSGIYNGVTTNGDTLILISTGDDFWIPVGGPNS